MVGLRMIQRSAYITAFLFITFSVHSSFGQTTTVNASIDRNKILIGEPIRLTLEASVPLQANATWFQLDTIPHFDIIEQIAFDSSANQTHRSFKQSLVITSFDSGRWAIPSLALEVNGRSYLTDSLPVSVAFSNFDPNQDYHDIKDILEVENPAVRYINWIVGAVTLISLLAVIYFVRKSRLRSAMVHSAVMERLNPYDEAIQLLNQLSSEQLLEKGQSKLYYSRLNDILRLFIQRKYGFRTMEKTNEEMLLQVKETGFAHDELIRLAQTLRLSDAVKFAKYLPSGEDNQESYHTIKKSVESLNNIPSSAL